MGRKAQNLKTGLIVYNLAILGMFLVFILTIESNSEIILTGFVLFFGNLVLPFLGFLREEIWGKYVVARGDTSIAALIVICVGWVLR